MKYLEKLIPWALFGVILFVAFWIRIQGVPNIPEGQFTGNDPYLYYWQAQIISEHGKLPARDMHRWQPVGRDNGQTLNLYGYVLAHAHKAVAVVFPNVTLYHVSLYIPVVCFCIGLGALCLFLAHTYGFLFSGIAGVLLATLPGTIDRSIAGFSDRDSWCLMLGIFAVITYLASLQAQRTHSRLLWTLVSGFTVFLGGISWEGFGVFLSIILCVELWKFLTSEKEDRLRLYLLWVCTFVPTLYLASPAYRGGEGFTTHLFAFVIVPPLVLLGLRSLRHVLLRTPSLADKFRPHARNLSLGLTLASLTLALGYVWMQFDTFTSTTVLSRQNELMQSVGELSAPIYHDWVFRYGSLFFLGSLGLISIGIYFWKRLGTVFSVPVLLFMLTTFFQTRLDTFLGTFLCNLLFFLSIAGVAMALIFIAWWQRESPKHELVYIAIAVWFLVWVSLARGAQRYDFFLGLAIAFFTAALIHLGASMMSEKLKHAPFFSEAFRQRIRQPLLNACIAVFMLAVPMFWTPAGA